MSIHRNSVYRLIEAGLLRYVRLAGGEIRIPLAAIDEYLAGIKPDVTVPAPKRGRRPNSAA